MKDKGRFVVLSLLILFLSILLVFHAIVGASSASDTQTPALYDLLRANAVGAKDETSNAGGKGNEKQNRGEEDEGMDREGVKEDLEDKKVPSDLQEKPSTDGPSDEERLPVNPRDDDELANL